MSIRGFLAPEVPAGLESVCESDDDDSLDGETDWMIMLFLDVLLGSSAVAELDGKVAVLLLVPWGLDAGLLF